MKVLLISLASAAVLAACGAKSSGSETAASRQMILPLKITKYTCFQVNSTDEWRLSIDLESKKASFFDNDQDVEVPLVQQMSLESNPPQELYIFEGDHAGGSTGAKLRITFNETKLTGHVTLELGSEDEVTHVAEGGCAPDEGQ